MAESTRMYSSRMRTVRSSSRLLKGGACSGEARVPGPGEGLLPGGCLLQWGCLLGGDVILTCTEADPPSYRMTDMCKNITFATSSIATTLSWERTKKNWRWRIHRNFKTTHKCFNEIPKLCPCDATNPQLLRSVVKITIMYSYPMRSLAKCK